MPLAVQDIMHSFHLVFFPMAHLGSDQRPAHMKILSYEEI